MNAKCIQSVHGHVRNIQIQYLVNCNTLIYQMENEGFMRPKLHLNVFDLNYHLILGLKNIQVTGSVPSYLFRLHTR